MSAVHRVYVGGLPPSSSAEELSALINKIVPVSSIYFPDVSVTGLHRGFAIVSIAGTSEQLSKCIRTFNACRWKGARLRFETAKQYYIDRLDEEREEQISMESVEVTEVEPMKEVSRGGMLKLKCGKNKYTYVPTFSTTNTIIKFDTDDEFDSDEYEELNGCSDSESESGSESTSAPNVPDDSASICSDTDVDTDTDTDTDTDSNTDLDLNKKSVSDNVPTTDSTSRIEVGVLQNTAIESVGVKPKGGGRRVGFGTISESSSTDVEKKSTVKTTSTTEADSDLIGLADGQPDKDVYDDDEFGNDCDFEEENEANIEDENALCVENWELEDNALEAERLRQRAMVEKLMNMGLSSASEEKIGSIGVGDSCADGTATILKTLPVEKVNKWHVQPNLRFDPTALARPTSIGSESDETTQKRLRFELATSEQALRDEELTRSATTVGKSADHPASGGTISNENFANITELKGIFLGPGGESSTQQPVPEDNLFSEAEKIGIDVRDDTGGSLLFNFFDQGSETAAPSSSLPMATTITTNDNATSDNAELPDDTTIDVLPVQQVTALPISLPNLSTVFSKAFSFHRDMDVQEINEVWKNTKEKLVVDYKRKSKEARKRKRSSLASFSDTTSGSKSHYTGNSRKKVDTKIRNKKIRAKKA